MLFSERTIYNSTVDALSYLTYPLYLWHGNLVEW
jgi:hypothetical protein